MKSSSNLNISCKIVFSLNKWNKKVGSPSSFRRKRLFTSLNSSASIENLSSSERARARARANHAKNDAQKGCAMQLNGITLNFHVPIMCKPMYTATHRGKNRYKFKIVVVVYIFCAFPIKPRNLQPKNKLPC